MLSLGSIFVILVVISTVVPDSIDDSYEATKKCREGANEKVEPGSKEAKCVVACYLTTLGVMNGSNQLVADKLQMIIDIEPPATSGKTVKDITKTVGDKCKLVTDKDKCEAAAKILLCVSEEIQIKLKKSENSK